MTSTHTTGADLRALAAKHDETIDRAASYASAVIRCRNAAQLRLIADQVDAEAIPAVATALATLWEDAGRAQLARVDRIDLDAVHASRASRRASA